MRFWFARRKYTEKRKMIVINLRPKLNHPRVKKHGRTNIQVCLVLYLEYFRMFHYAVFVFFSFFCFFFQHSWFAARRFTRSYEFVWSGWWWWGEERASWLKLFVSVSPSIYPAPSSFPRILPFLFVESFSCRERLSRGLYGLGGGTRRIKTHRCLMDGPLSGDVYLFGRRLHLNRSAWQDSL